MILTVNRLSQEQEIEAMQIWEGRKKDVYLHMI
jgi:hypothetical protein